MATKVVEIGARPAARAKHESMDQQIRRKLASYARQDERQQRPSDENIDAAETAALLESCAMACFYCGVAMDAAGRQQWTLDRVENHIAHTKRNVVASCLRCNLKKKRRNSDKFLMGAEIARRVASGGDAVTRLPE